ncbi:uncharacterized protein LOC119739145 [Patiria miniata]|uniref:DUF4440 domain-containing protein n=1 Tax=Patiria miniata TaxID=46514 RepID=A0A914B329_PATMI|nr:uncharacterized protein LOC119739145 [Patiria miniata]
MSPTTYLCAFLAAGMMIVGATADSVTDKIKAESAKYVDRGQKHDIDGMLELYTDDMVLMPQGHGTVTQGKPYAKTHMAWVNHVRSITMDTKEVAPLNSCSGDNYVFQRSETVAINDKDVVIFKGKNLIIWKKVGDSYKIYTHMYNMDQ